MITQLIELLNAHKDIEWAINKDRVESSELFFVHNNLEMNRAKEVSHIFVTVYVSFDNFKGSSTFKVYETMTKVELEEEINEGIKAARLVANKPFDLAKVEEVKEHLTKSNMEGLSLEEISYKIAELLFSIKLEEGASLNANEVFANLHHNEFYNSNGVHLENKVYDADLEFISTFQGKDESVEVYNYLTFASLDEDKIRNDIIKGLNTAKLRSTAIPTKSFNNIDVVFNTTDDLVTLLEYFTNKCLFQSIYNKQSNAEVGFRFQEENCEGDKLNITIDPFIKSSVLSSTYDGLGFINHTQKIVEDGKVISLFGSRQYAQYMNQESKVSSPNFVVGKGTLTDKELENKEYFEILSMSGIQIDDMAGSFGGEIRCALYHDGKGNVYSMSGGSISGLVKDYINTWKLSDKIIEANYYNGPAKLMIKGARILGK